MAAYGGDDLLHSVPGAAVGHQVLMVHQHRVLLDGSHAHACLPFLSFTFTVPNDLSSWLLCPYNMVIAHLVHMRIGPSAAYFIILATHASLSLKPRLCLYVHVQISAGDAWPSLQFELLLDMLHRILYYYTTI